MPVGVPVEVNNSPIELHLPAEAKEKRAVVESKPSPFEENNSIIELHLPIEAKENRAIIESKVKPSPVEVNNSTIVLKKINHTASCDIDNQRTMFDGKRLSKSTFKTKLRRNREPSRIPVKKYLTILKRNVTGEQ